MEEHPREYQPGDLGFVASGHLAEIISVHDWGYRALLTPMLFNRKEGRYRVTCGGEFALNVPREELKPLRWDNINFSSLAKWQKYIDQQSFTVFIRKNNSRDY